MSNIRKPLYAVKAGVIIILLASISQAQPPLLGAANNNASPTRTPSGFTLFGRGFIGKSVPHNRIRKSVNWLSNHRALGEVPAFVIFGTSIGDHWYLLEQTDAAWEATQARWIACGGRYAEVAGATSPRRISIYIESSPFTHPAHAGLKLNGLTDGRTIRAVIASVNGVATDRPWLVTYRQVVEYEMGNLLGVALGIPWTGYANEIGSGSPCGQ